jgi:hypothetical protein
MFVGCCCHYSYSSICVHVTFRSKRVFVTSLDAALESSGRLKDGLDCQMLMVKGEGAREI